MTSQRRTEDSLTANGRQQCWIERLWRLAIFPTLTVPVVWSDRAPRCILTIFSAVTILGVVPSLVSGVNVLPPVSLVNLGMCRPPRGVRSPRAQLDAQSAGCGLLRCRLVRRGSASATRSTRHSRCPRSDPPRAHDAPLSCSGFPRFPWPPAVLFLLAQGSHPSLGRPSFLASHCAARHAYPFLGRPFFLSTRFALRRAPRPPACAHAR